MKKLTFTICLLLLQLSLNAQQHSKNIAIKNLKDIGVFITNNYVPNEDSVKNNCWKGVVAVRFKIDEKHQLSNIAYNVSTPVFIQQALRKSILWINGRGIDIDQSKNNANKTYILPIIIVNDAGCGVMTGWEDKKDEPTTEMKLMFERRRLRFDKFDESSSKIMDLLTVNLI